MKNQARKLVPGSNEAKARKARRAASCTRSSASAWLRVRRTAMPKAVPATAAKSDSKSAGGPPVVGSDPDRGATAWGSSSTGLVGWV